METVLRVGLKTNLSPLAEIAILVSHTWGESVRTDARRRRGIVPRTAHFATT